MFLLLHSAVGVWHPTPSSLLPAASLLPHNRSIRRRLSCGWLDCVTGSLPSSLSCYYIALLKPPPNAHPSFHDVLSTDDWALAMVGQPVLAVLFLFPVKPVSEAHRREEAERVQREGQVVSPGLFYMAQEIGNACGTVRSCLSFSQAGRQWLGRSGLSVVSRHSLACSSHLTDFFF